MIMQSVTENTCIGIDIGGTNLRLALVDKNGLVLQRERLPTSINLGRDTFIRCLCESIAKLRDKASVMGSEAVALGVGVPGLISATGDIFSSVNLLPLEGINLSQILVEVTGLPTVVLNDANACAWGEKCYGAGRSFSSMLMVTIGTGVGGGLILADRLWTGIDGVSGEFGHFTVEPDGIPCGCGNYGCLEQYASASAISSAAIREIAAGADTILSEEATDELTAEVVARAVSKGDVLARKIYERAGRYLGIAAASVINLLNLEGIVLGGGVSASYNLLAFPMQDEISRRAFAIPARRVSVVKGELGDDAGLLGAAAMAWDSL